MAKPVTPEPGNIGIAVFSGAAGTGKVAAHLVGPDDFGAAASLCFDLGKVTAGAMQLSGLVLSAELVAQFAQTIPQDPPAILSVTLYCDNIPMVDYAMAANSGDGTLPIDSHLERIHLALRERLDGLRGQGHHVTMRVPRRLRRSKQMQLATESARLAAETSIQMPDDLYAALLHSAKVLKAVAKDDRQIMMRL